MRTIFVGIMILFLLAACGTPTPQTSETPKSGETSEVSPISQPTATATVTLTPTESATPTPAVPAEKTLTAADLADTDRFVLNENGTYSPKDHPDIFIDGNNGTVTIPFNGEQLVQPMQAYSEKDGKTYIGLFVEQNGVFVPERGYTAAEALAGVIPERAVFIDAGKEGQGVEAMFAARDYLMENTPGYTPASEFEGLTITLNFETFENFDPRPEKWSFVNRSTIPEHDGQFEFIPKAPDDAVKYNDGSTSSVVYGQGATLDYARPLQVGLGGGWVPVKIIGSDGKEQEPTWQIPVVAMDTDGSIICGSALVRAKDIPRMIKVLNRENRGKLNMNIPTKAHKDSYAIDDLALVSLASGVNDGFCRTVGCPEKNEERYVYELPDIFGRLIFNLSTRKDQLVNGN